MHSSPSAPSSPWCCSLLVFPLIWYIFVSSSVYPFPCIYPLSHLILSMWHVCQPAQGQETLDTATVWSGENVRVREAKGESTAMNMRVPAFYLHACIRTFLHALSHNPFYSLAHRPSCFYLLLSCGLSCGSSLTVCPYAAFHRSVVASASKGNSRCFFFVSTCRLCKLCPHTSIVVNNLLITLVLRVCMVKA